MSEKPRELNCWNPNTEDVEDVDLDPLFVALILRLPKRNSHWAKASRDSWIALFNGIADSAHPESAMEKPARASLIVAQGIERPAHQSVAHETSIKTTHEVKRVITHNMDDGGPKAPIDLLEGNKYAGARAEIIRILRESGKFLNATQIYEAGNFADKIGVANELSHMTLRKGWLRREKMDGLFVYQVSETAPLPASL